MEYMHLCQASFAQHNVFKLIDVAVCILVHFRLLLSSIALYWYKKTCLSIYLLMNNL